MIWLSADCFWNLAVKISERFFAIVRLAAVALAISTAFAAIPHAELILLSLGIIASASISLEGASRFYILAILLSIAPPAFDVLPVIGSYLHTAFASQGVSVTGVALGCVAKGVYNRMKSDWFMSSP